MTTASSDRHGPLAGIRVLDLTSVVSGPMCTQQLGDLGADVIKLESPGGDQTRYSGAPFKEPLFSAMHTQMNRNKRSLVVDLKNEAGRDLVLELIPRIDVVVENFRPHVMAGLGLGYEALAEIHPGLVFCSINGFGSDGPYADQKVYDYVIQALTGMASLQEERDGRPSLVKNIVIDKVTAYTVAQAVTAALLARERGQGGQHIEISMLDVGLAFMWPDAMADHVMLDDDVRLAPHMATYYEVRPASDGFVAQMAISDRQFPGMCRVLGTERWLEDPRFATMELRIENAVALGELVEEEFAKHRSADLVAALHEQDVPAAVIRPLAEVHEDPQVVHNGTLVERDLPTVGRVREPMPAIRFGSTPTALGDQAPMLDEHTDDVLRELGHDDASIARLRESRAVGAQR